MDLRDFIVTPFAIIGIYALAYYFRRRLYTIETKKYFWWGLTVKIIGAFAIGFLYQFYYDGGDTYNYHTYGSRIIWEAFVDDPVKGLSLIFAPEGQALHKYTSRIIFFSDPSSYFVVRFAALIDIITFSTYSATAVIFAFISFLGMWFMFLTFYRLYPDLKSKIALCVLFIPSVVVWGSGLLKDSLVIGCLGFATFAIKKIFIDRKPTFATILMLLVSLFFIFEIKKYVLLCFFPAAIFWAYSGSLRSIRSLVLRIMLIPIVIIGTIATGVFAIVKVGENDRRYAIDKIAETSTITAHDIGFYSGRNAGSGYALGELDGSVQSMVALFPQAVNVSLFRPYLWEVRNPLMFLSAIESFGLLLITAIVLIRRPLAFLGQLLNPTVIFCLMFSITFAFAVGVSTFNFGTLSPLPP